jgi:hypothetical protein
MFDPSRRLKGAAPGADLSPALRACAPYIKLLDEALVQLPAGFVFRGRVQRGVKWVYPRPDTHDPEAYFAPGAVLMWYEFKSSSQKKEVMSRPQVGPCSLGTLALGTHGVCSVCGRRCRFGVPAFDGG